MEGQHYNGGYRNSVTGRGAGLFWLVIVSNGELLCTPQREDKQIPDTRSPGRLNFVIFLVGFQYGLCFMPPIWKPRV